MMSIMDMYALIAAEFHMHVPDTVPVFHIMFLAATAEKRRKDRQKAAQNGQSFVG